MTNIEIAGLTFAPVEIPKRVRARGARQADKYAPLIKHLTDNKTAVSLVKAHDTEAAQAEVRALVQHVRQAAKAANVTAMKSVEVSDDGKTATVTFWVVPRVGKNGQPVSTETADAAPESAPAVAPEPEDTKPAAKPTKAAPKPSARRR